MHPLFAQAAGLTSEAIGTAIEGGRIVNFNELKLTGGVPRFIIPVANLE
jgi:hypothetical protein